MKMAFDRGGLGAELPEFFWVWLKKKVSQISQNPQVLGGGGVLWAPGTGGGPGPTARTNWAPPVILKTVGLGSATGRHQPKKTLLK